MHVINPLPIPLPLNRNPRPRKSIIDIHTIDIHRGALLTPIGLVAEGDGETLVCAGLDEACCRAGFGVDVRDVFGEGEACFGVVDGGLEAVVDGHCGGVGEGGASDEINLEEGDEDRRWWRKISRARTASESGRFNWVVVAELCFRDGMEVIEREGRDRGLCCNLGIKFTYTNP
jgi:hypothetical protein